MVGLEERHVVGTNTMDVLSTADARAFIGSVDVTFSDNSLKSLISDPKNDDAFFLVSKSIGSKITITDVKVLDDAFIYSVFA